MSINTVQYQIVASRRQATDTLMWQTPALCLTAQAFLFTIALDSQSVLGARSVAMALSVAVSLACIQLMCKHRHYEVLDSQWLEANQSHVLGSENLVVDHGREVKLSLPSSLWDVSGCLWKVLVYPSSFSVWVVLQLMFLVIALTLLMS